MRGLIEYLEQNPVKTLEAWYEGLRLSRGTNAQLTWRLANVELEQGNDGQAEKLIEQYRRLARADSPSLAWLEIQQDERAGRLESAGERLNRMLASKGKGTNRDVEAFDLETMKEPVRTVLGRCLEK